MPRKKKSNEKKKKKNGRQEEMIRKAAYLYALDQSKGACSVQEVHKRFFRQAMKNPDKIPAKYFPGRKKP